jgi:hypothetical protein
MRFSGARPDIPGKTVGDTGLLCKSSAEQSKKIPKIFLAGH